jgi:hypothetical protein
MRLPRGASCIASNVYQRSPTNASNQGVQIHGIKQMEITDHNPRRDPQRPAERNRQMRKIPADPGSLPGRVHGRSRLRAGPVLIFQLPMDPGPDRLRLLITGLRLAGNRRRHLQKLVGFAVAAGQQIRQGILGQVLDERETGIGIDGDLLRRLHGEVLVMTERPAGRTARWATFPKGL